MIPFEDFKSEITLANASLNLGMSLEQIEAASKFAVILHRENDNQNLTRILGAKEFIYGHLIDVLQLFHVEQLGSRVLDIGSGSGVPGLLAAAMDTSNRQWLLIDSEESKADYLEAAAKELGLNNVTVKSGRAEKLVIHLAPDTIIARAVGTVGKIASWIERCSTWNNLILFKSRGWSEEWNAAQSHPSGKKLTVTQEYEYSSEDKYRLLVSLKRQK